MPGASVSSSVETDGFCLGAAGPIFVLSLQLFWNGLRLADSGNLDYENLVFDGKGSAVNGEFDLQRVVTQEELVKRDTPPGAMREGGVHCCSSALERANFADRAGASPGDCPLQGCPRFGISRRPGANRCCRDLEVAPLSFGVCPCGPLVRESDRLHAKLECAEESDLPYVVSDYEVAGGKAPLRCVPMCGQRVGAKFCEPELQNALVQVHGDPLRRRRGRGVVRVLCSLHSALELGRRRQVVVYILVMLILSLRAFCLACHQLTVIALCLTSLTVVARCMRV